MGWNEGYVTDLLYTYGYYTELNPLTARLLLLINGIACKSEFDTACELGFGQGMSVNIHAASSSTSWYGTDFNPAQVDFAKSLAKKSELKVNLYDDSFEQFVNNPDIPNFDFIGLHGIWSWISDESREAILKIIEKKLNVGGVVYCSYNVDPGFTVISPIQHLMKHYNDLNHHGSSDPRCISDSVNFIEDLFNLNAKYALANPTLKERLKRISSQDRHYLAHEFFNSHWDLLPFDEIAKQFEDVKLNFAVSADFKDSVPNVNLTFEQQAKLNQIDDRVFRETVRDFMLNQQFRRDYFVKGLRFLTPLEQREQLLKLKFMLKQSTKNFEYKLQAPIGEFTLKQEMYEPLLKLFADLKAHSVAEILETYKNLNLSSLMSCLIILSAKGTITVVQDPSSKVVDSALRLNKQILTNYTSTNNIHFLASPVTGGGILVNTLDQILIKAYQNQQVSLESPAIAAFMTDLLKKNHANIQNQGKKIDLDTQEGQESILKMAEEFIENLSIYKALKVIA